MTAGGWAARYAGRRVLITGGLGFIGSNLAIRLAEHGAEVTVLDALIPEHGGDRFNVAPVASRIRIDTADLRDAHVLPAAVRDQEFVFHLAGQVSHGDSMRDPELDLTVNCVATINLVEACRQFNPEARLIYTSTRQVYGVPRSLPVSEDHPPAPVDVNGINKLAAEHYHLLYERTYGLRSAVLRLTNTYGPRQHIRNDRQGFVGVFIRHALRGEPIRLFGTGTQVRDLNYVDDVVDALVATGVTAGCYGRVLNLGAPRRYSLLELVEVLGGLCPVKAEVVPFPEDRKLIDIGDYYGDYSRFAALTGWQPRIELAEGLERTLAFYRRHPETYWA
ncbi:MAG: NAD-dependent epimerase/dehydratase family protein [Nitrospirota bacterium]|jgi:nucleoside-diphosphate-sugar epimerase